MQKHHIWYYYMPMCTALLFCVYSFLQSLERRKSWCYVVWYMYLWYLVIKSYIYSFIV